MLYREQNLRFTEVTHFTRMLERLIDAVHQLFDESPTTTTARRKALRDDVDANLKLYEAELYQDRYATSHAAQEREAQRAAEGFRAKQQAFLAKVHKFSEDG